MNMFVKYLQEVTTDLQVVKLPWLLLSAKYFLNYVDKDSYDLQV